MAAPSWLLAALPPLFWAGNVVLGRALHAELPPLALAFWRWLFAALILLPFAIGALRTQWPILRRHWRMLSLLALLGISGYNTFLYLGLQTTTATNGVLLTSTCPVLIVVFSFLLLRQGIRVSQAFGILLSLLGVVLILTQGNPARLVHLRLDQGDAWILVAALTWALYSVSLRWRPAGLDPLAFLVAIMILGVIPLLPLYLWELSQGYRIQLSLVNLAAIGYVALFPSVLAYVFWNRAVAELGPNRTGLFIHLIPAFGALLAMLLLGEQLGGFHAAGIALILAGIWFATPRR
ncbi:DMT family transporter [Thiorhodococcus mannitoliphagus]|uniref:DMT family transporter n=1 Tax=Thiorhodococcus mannitoliphagus TaxID=329406 RepID=A0A6P1DYU6_9GAMM|nr:DMT family transporter [Thiorhodococcus mannitoliphagus]NEX20884.1 DMT family transporter [Thiorhodococcus mannitoliphagus]